MPNQKSNLPPANSIDEERIHFLYEKASQHIDSARQKVQKTINTQMIKAYWLIGRDIIEEE